MKWEAREITHEPLKNLLAKDIAIDLARYADENQLLDQPGWQLFQQIAKPFTMDCNKII